MSLRAVHAVPEQVRGYAHFEHNLLHLLIRALKLSDEDQHDLPGVVVGGEVVHQWNEVADGLEEGGQTLQTQDQPVVQRGPNSD